MKKVLIFFLLATLWIPAWAQYQSVTVTGQTATVGTNKKLRFVWGSNIFNISDSIAAATGGTIPAGPILTNNALVGFNPGTNLTANQWINKVFYAEPQPNATFTGTEVLELTSASTASGNLPYSYSKVTGSTDFASATVNGSMNGVTQNINGSSGNYAATWNTNTTTTFTFVATTVGGQSKSISITKSYSARRYYGRAAGATPTTTEILGSAGGGNALSGSKAGTFIITVSGTNYPFFAYPSSLGTLTSIKDANGLEAITSYNTGTVSLTNGQGYIQTYRYYVAQNATAGNTTMVTQ